VDSESLNKLLKKFKKIADKNGSVEKDKFKALIESFFKGSDGTLNRMILLLFDRDGSSNIDVREFIMTLSLISSNSTDWKGRVELAYLSADLNSDGSITRDELRAVFRTCRKIQIYSASNKSKPLDSIVLDPKATLNVHDDADKVFDTIAKKDPKAITKDELVAACEADEEIRKKILATLVLDHTKAIFDGL
jgi:hypothetical protein